MGHTGGKEVEEVGGKMEKKKIHLKDLGICRGIIYIGAFKIVVGKCGLYSAG